MGSPTPRDGPGCTGTGTSTQSPWGTQVGLGGWTCPDPPVGSREPLCLLLLALWAGELCVTSFSPSPHLSPPQTLRAWRPLGTTPPRGVSGSRPLPLPLPPRPAHRMWRPCITRMCNKKQMLSQLGTSGCQEQNTWARLTKDGNTTRASALGLGSPRWPDCAPGEVAVRGNRAHPACRRRVLQPAVAAHRLLSQHWESGPFHG